MMVNRFYRAWMSVFAAIAPAVAGALMFARFSAERDMRLSMALVIGIFCGVVVMFAAKTNGWTEVLVAAVVSVAGVALGFVFDAKWNAFDVAAAQMAKQIAIQTPELTPDAAMMQARTIVGGMTRMELIQSRLNLIGWLSPLFAVLGAALTVKSRFIARLLRVNQE